MGAVTLSRTSALFGGSDEWPGATWAAISFLVKTRELNGLQSHACLNNLLTQLAGRERLAAGTPWQTYALTVGRS